MRTTGPVPAAVDTPALHAAVLAYAGDYSMLEPVLRRHGHTFAEPGIKMASPSAQAARGLGLSRIFTRDGLLAASVAQEGMIRVPG